MELENFCEKVAIGLQEFMGDAIVVSRQKAVKNNGVCLEAVSLLQKEAGISPTIYMNSFYEEFQDGKPISSIIYEISKIYEGEEIAETISMDFFRDYEKAKKKIVYKIVNYEKNSSMLTHMPHIRFLDLAVVFYCLIINDHIDSATVMIKNEHMQMWGINLHDLYVAAGQNTPQYLRLTVTDIRDVIEDCQELEKFEENNNYMYIISNHTKIFGAAGMLYNGVLEELAERFDSELVILPSSIHEVILVPVEGINMRQAAIFEEMVREVNETQLQEEEFLSDSVYYYSRKKGIIEVL